MKSPLALAALVALALAGVGCKRGSHPKSSTTSTKPPAGTTAGTGSGSGSAAQTSFTAQPDPRTSRAAELYKTHCALCHGPQAQGYAADNAPSLVNPTFLDSVDDAFLKRSIELGRPGTAMAGFGRDVGGPLDDTQIADLIALFRSGRAPAPALPPAPTGGDATRGAAIYDSTCKQCHGDPSVRGTAPHLANPVFISLARDEFIAYAIRHGRPGTPMEAFALGDQQIADVIAHLRSWTPNTPPAPPPVPPPPPPSDGPVVLNPKGKAPVFTLTEDRYVSAAQVKKAMEEKRKLIIIDARPPSDWSQMRIPGAISAPFYQLDTLDRVPNDGTWVVAYCACPHHASGAVVDELRKRGYKHTAVLDEGIMVWNQLGYPTTGQAAEAMRNAAKVPGTTIGPMPMPPPAPAPH
ncbi:MAG TPA: c-type cytochrome [Kofleriaceae bacterium]|nr:c-type cytochrome [Kofleriaceae bacterium]